MQKSEKIIKPQVKKETVEKLEVFTAYLATAADE